MIFKITLLFLAFIQNINISSITDYVITCHKKDINYYICGNSLEASSSIETHGTLYSPVATPIYTTLFHSYPDIDLPHRGVDIIGDLEIMPAFSGTVVESCSTFCGSYGKHIILYHETLEIYTLYAHLDDVYVNIGENVSRLSNNEGIVIGLMGNTGLSEGRHLHFEVRNNQSHEYQYRLDPVSYLNIHLTQCNNMFGLIDALLSPMHRYQQWYGLSEEQYIFTR